MYNEITAPYEQPVYVKLLRLFARQFNRLCSEKCGNIKNSHFFYLQNDAENSMTALHNFLCLCVQNSISEHYPKPVKTTPSLMNITN